MPELSAQGHDTSTPGLDEAAENARRTTLALIAARARDATVCPSEVARSLARETGKEWREMMPVVHAAVDQLMGEDLVRLSWKGQPLATRSGPYRIARRS